MIKFNNGIVERFTLVLSTRNFKHLGALCNVSDLNYVDNMNTANEISFTVNKEVNEETENLWDELNDLRIIWVKEQDEYFEISVKVDEQHNTVKNVIGKSLCESELSQVYLHNLEINTEKDLIDGYYTYDKITGEKTYIKGTGYGVGSLFYDESNTAKSILHRVLDKVPNYEIGHIDESLKTLTKLPEFTFDGTDILSALNTIAEEFDCLFKFEVKNINGVLTRVVNAYDLESNCYNNECSHYQSTGKRYRGIFSGACPKCGSTNFSYYGKDTSIYTSVDNLTDSISLEAKVDEVKNVFKLKAADEIMETAIINCNGGSQYMYNIPTFMRKDMSKGLNDRLDKYYESLNLYKTSYANTSKEYYKCYSWFLYLQSGMMPSSDIQSQVTPDTELSKIQDGFVSYGNKMSLPSNTKSESSIITSIKNFAKSFIFTGEVRVQIDKSKCNFVKDSDGYITNCSGMIVITSFSDDSTASSSFSLTIDTDYVQYIRQRIDNTISTYKDLETYEILGKIKEPNILRERLVGKDASLSITDDNAFVNSLNGISSTEFAKNHKVGYSYNRIKSFYDAYESALNMLNQLDQTYISSFTENYSLMKNACKEALEIRQFQMDAFDVSIISTPTYKALDEMTKLKSLMSFDAIVCLKDLGKGVYYKCSSSTPGAIQVTSDNRKDIQYYISNINIGDFVIYNYDKTYYKEFCNFRRETSYENPNYTSVGQNNDSLSLDTLYERANEFVQKATDELIKSSTLQYTISSNLNNFLLIPDFAPIVDNFKVGNWIRIRVEEVVYRLRLISYSINFDNLQTISCEFSDVAKTANGYNDIEEILSQASSMASSFISVTKQAEAGNTANKLITNFVSDGIQNALGSIKNNTNEEIVIDNNGIIGRSYDPFTQEYSDEQIRITSNLLMFTDDNWETGETALGKHTTEYYYFNGNSIVKGSKTAYGLSADFVAANTVMTDGILYGSSIIGGDIYSSNYNKSGKIGTHIDLANGNIDIGGDKFVYDITNGLSISSKIKGSEISGGSIEGSIITGSTFGNKNGSFSIDSNGNVVGATIKNSNGTFQVSSDGKITGGTIIGAVIKNSEYNPTFFVDSEGKLIASNAEISGKIDAGDGKIGGWSINTDSLSGTAIVESNTYSTTLKPSGMTFSKDDMDIVINPHNIGWIKKDNSLTSVIRPDGIYSPIMYADKYGLSSGSHINIDGTNNGKNSFGGISLNAGSNGINITTTCTNEDAISITGATRFNNKVTFGVSATFDGVGWLQYNGSNGIIGYDGDGRIGAPGNEDNYLRGTCYYNSKEITSSDERLKYDFDTLEKYEDFFFDLQPCTFKLITGVSGRIHNGFKAQGVKKALESNGLTTQEFSGYVEHKVSIAQDDQDIMNAYEKAGLHNGDIECGLRYGEFISLNTHMIQKAYKIINNQEETIEKQQKLIDSLEKRLSEIEEKLKGVI